LPHVRVEFRVQTSPVTGEVKKLTLQADMDGLPPRRWELSGPVDRADVRKAMSIMDVARSELVGLTIGQYNALPLVTRVKSATDLALSVSNIRSSFPLEE